MSAVMSAPRWVLRIHREGEEDKDYTITRDAIPEKTAAAQMLPEGMGYIRIASFSEKTGQEFKDCLADMEGQGMKGLIRFAGKSGRTHHQLCGDRQSRRAKRVRSFRSSIVTATVRSMIPRWRSRSIPSWC